MIGKKIYFDDIARRIITAGIEPYEKAVVGTLGPYGKRSLLWNGVGDPVITKDGVTVSKEISSKNRVVNAVLEVLKSGANKTNKEAGDGTTTTTLLSCALLKEGFKMLDRGYSGNRVSRGMHLAANQIIEELGKCAREALDEDTIRKVANVSSNQDSEITNNTVDAFAGIGDYGVVTITDSANDKTYVKTTTGLEIKRGYISSMFKNNDEEDCFKADNPMIFVSHKPITDIKQIYPLIMKATTEERALVMIAQSFKDKVLELITNNLENDVCHNICCINNPGFNDSLRATFSEDFGKAFNCEVANWKQSEELPEDWEDLGYIGTCESVKITATSSVFIGTSENDAFKEHVESLKAELKKMEEDVEVGHTQFEKDKLKERIARLCGGVSTIFVGGVTSTELIEKKHRYEDAASAVRVALVKGVLPGGGIALYKIGQKLLKNPIKTADKDIEAGWRLVVNTCMKPFSTVLEHMDYSEDEITAFKFALMKVSKSPKNFFKGPDMSGKCKHAIDFFEAGILDPLVVVEQSVKNSVSVASSLISVGSIVVDDIPDSISVDANDPDVLAANKLF